MLLRSTIPLSLSQIWVVGEFEKSQAIPVYVGASRRITKAVWAFYDQGDYFEVGKVTRPAPEREDHGGSSPLRDNLHSERICRI